MVYSFFSEFDFQCVRNNDATSKLLKTLLTTTPSTSHISDFRQQRRSDSRADKPDTFIGFDLQDLGDTPTTLSPRKRRQQAYSQLIHGLLKRTRERLHSIRDIVKDENQLQLKLNRKNNETSSENDQQQIALLEFSDPEANVEYEFALNNENGAEMNVTLFRKYFSSFLSRIGLSRNEHSNEKSEKQINRLKSPTPTVSIPEVTLSFLHRYFLKPLAGIWQATVKKYYNFHLNASDDMKIYNDDSNNGSENAQNRFSFNSFDSGIENDEIDFDVDDNTKNGQFFHLFSVIFMHLFIVLFGFSRFRLPI